MSRGVNSSHASGADLRVRFAVAAGLLACALAWALALPATAHAVVNLGNLTVSAPGSVSVASGGTVSVSAPCNPPFSDQLPCCLNDYCPSGCDFDKQYGESGVGCADASGQCTCFGYSYSRYYPDCAVASSNPAVCTAGWADGVLVVSGYEPGSATLTLYPSMRLWTGVPAYVTVNVSGGASSGGASSGGAAAADGSAAGGSPSAGGSSAGGGAGASAGGGAVAVVQSMGGATNQMTGQATNNVVTVVSTIERAGDEAVVEAADGSVIAHVDDAATDVPGLLAGAAGREVVLSLWGGKNAEVPDYIWEISGVKLPADADYSGIDLAVREVTYSNGALKDALGDAPYSAFTVPGSGKLPCTMQLVWRSVGTVDNGQVVDVYLFDEAAGAFKKVHSNLTTGEGYVVFNLIESGTYVVTPDSGLSERAAGEQAAEAIADDGNAAAGAADAAAGPGLPGWAVPAAIACAAVIIAAVAFAVARRGKRD